ncbi:MAG: ATP-binding protein [Clostridia bacterium]|nr:ATP-binding protein [Clostridia bacterium]
MRDVTEALRVIEERKSRAEREYEDLLATLLAEEKFETDYRRLSYLNFEIARREVYRLDATELITERDALRGSVESAIASRGALGLDMPKYACRECRDTGYVGGKRCKCLEKARVEVDLRDNPSLRSVPNGLKDVDVSFYGDKQDAYLKYLKNIRKNFVKGDASFFTLIGRAGTGKTFIALTAVKESLLDGKMVRVVNAVQLNKIFLEYHCAYLNEKGDVWEQLVEPDVLLIDDLGAESILKNVTEQYLYELLVERMDKKTIITTNLSLDKIAEKYNQRIMSRLSDKRHSMVVEIEGEDLRLR